jgi:prenyltransferase beta subunit
MAIIRGRSPVYNVPHVSEVIAMRRTLLLALFLPFPLAAQTADEKQATIKFLTSLQQPDGGFVAAPPGPKADGKPTSSLRATSAAVRAIKYFGGELPNKDKTIQFVKSCYSRWESGFSDQPKGKVDVPTTAIGLMAVAELFLADFKKIEDDTRCVEFLGKNASTFEERRLAVAGMEAGKGWPRDTLNLWFAEVHKTANPDGTYGKGDGQARATGGVIAMYLRAGAKLPDDQRKAVIAALQAGQRADGGFGKAGETGSDGETTYRVMRAFHLLKEKPRDLAKVKEFFAKCRNADGGYGTAPSQPSTVSGTYYAASVGMWLAE